MTTTVLFMCPHSAGKSLLAATYFRAAAVRNELDVDIQLAGIDPDEENMPTVVDSLTRQGHVVDFSPNMITAAKADSADVIISIGCPIDEIPTDTPIREWRVPQLSENFAGSIRAIYQRVELLAAEMALGD